MRRRGSVGAARVRWSKHETEILFTFITDQEEWQAVTNTALADEAAIGLYVHPFCLFHDAMSTRECV